MSSQVKNLLIEVSGNTCVGILLLRDDEIFMALVQNWLRTVDWHQAIECATDWVNNNY